MLLDARRLCGIVGKREWPLVNDFLIDHCIMVKTMAIVSYELLRSVET